MSVADIIILSVIAIALFFSLRSAIGKRSKGDCGCGCSSCSSQCALRDAYKKEK